MVVSLATASFVTHALMASTLRTMVVTHAGIRATPVLLQVFACRALMVFILMRTTANASDALMVFTLTRSTANASHANILAAIVLQILALTVFTSTRVFTNACHANLHAAPVLPQILVCLA